jgi:predicted metal-dependent phosphoesterase TrpH
MGGLVDLHIHSDRSSDGSFPPAQILKMAEDEAMQAISITDHDTVAAYPEVLELSANMEVEVIPGIELTTLLGDREFHLLIPFIDWKKKIVKDLVDEVSRRRREEARDRVRRLQSLGFDITWEEVVEQSGDFPPLGVTIAQALIKKAERTGISTLSQYYQGENRMYGPYHFYRDYFAEGKPANVERRNVKLLDVLSIIPQTGGLAVLAHPGASFQRVTRDDLSLLKENGLAGLEVYTSYHDSEQTQKYKELAAEFDLIPTAGSDFHGEIKPQISFGSIKNGGYWMVEALKKRRH